MRTVSLHRQLACDSAGVGAVLDMVPHRAQTSLFNNRFVTTIIVPVIKGL